MREYIPNRISIDGRNIPYRIVTAFDYLVETGVLTTDVEYENWLEIGDNYRIYEKLTQLLAVKQSRFLLYHTSYSCQSLTDNLRLLEGELVNELLKLNFKVNENLIDEIEW